jgi:hypothetical protein
MSLKDIFNKENELLMFYHTTFRNIISLTGIAFVILSFFNINKNKNYLWFGELMSLILIFIAMYLNYTLIKIFYVNKFKSYKYIDNYYKINLFMAIVHIILIIIIFIKIKKDFN